MVSLILQLWIYIVYNFWIFVVDVFMIILKFLSLVTMYACSFNYRVQRRHWQVWKFPWKESPTGYFCMEYIYYSTNTYFQNFLKLYILKYLSIPFHSLQCLGHSNFIVCLKAPARIRKNVHVIPFFPSFFKIV